MVGVSHSGAVSRDFLKNKSAKSKKIKFGKTSWIKTVGKFLEVTFTGTRKVMAVFFSVSFEHIQQFFCGDLPHPWVSTLK